MKKNLIFVLAICLLFSLTACGISENEPKPTAEPLEKTVSPATEPPAEKPAEIPAAEQKTDAAEEVFTNEYGTSTTKCAHAGCTRPIASSGDTNCCTVHSGTCAKCGRYIDEDATWCMKCLRRVVQNRRPTPPRHRHLLQAAQNPITAWGNTTPVPTKHTARGIFTVLPAILTEITRRAEQKIARGCSN